ncbi:MAG: aldehyde dehydrogenase [Bacteroidota bacterium]|nr:aldehyde dehydrogenase [Bacteroidota bacterium]
MENEIIQGSRLKDMRRFFDSGATRSYEFRKEQLRILKAVIQKYEQEVIEALTADFRKPPFESFATEIGFVYEEINVALRNLKGWMRHKKVGSPLPLFPSSSRIYYEPFGVSLIIAPWNYPFQLAISPLVASIAAGNVSLVKPSELTPSTAAVIEKIMNEAFAPEFISVLQGDGAVVIPAAMEGFRFDHIFFTGSTEVGKKIAKAAAEKLIPNVLELGGKSPAIVDSTADLKVTARRIAWGKWVNAGQTCVAPDYLLVDRQIKDRFQRELVLAIREFYGEDPQKSPHFARIIHKKHLGRLRDLLKGATLISGGQIHEEDLYLAPTLVEVPDMDHPLMKEEIFGPILPIIPFEDFDDLKAVIKKNPNPLSLYLFSRRKSFQAKITEEIGFGGGAINNTLVHLANPELPFGGVGPSGMGRYHGEFGFHAFSHIKAMVKTGIWFDLKLKYPPYGDRALKLMRLLFR